jgi:acetolactate synthase-1/2/3 large subunit
VLLRTGAITGDVNPDGPPRLLPTPGYLNTSRPAATPDVVQKAVRLLAGARHPVIVAGNGVHTARAYKELKEMAELLAAPVATSYKGKSTLEETHPLSVGMVGIYGQQVANAVVGQADVVLVVGARLSPQDTVMEDPSVFDPTRQRIVQIDIDPRHAGWVFPVEVGIVGDAKVVLGQMLEAARALGQGPSDREQRILALGQMKKEMGFFEEPELHKDTSPVLPQRLVRQLQESLDPGTIITLDAGNNRAWMCHLYQSQQPGTFYVPGGIAGMGWALPSAFAVKLAQPARPVVGVTGDGGFVMSSHVLSTAVQYKVPAVFVVMNNGGLGMVQEHQGDRFIASEFSETDHARIAEAYGAFGVQVDGAKDLPKAIKEAMGSGRPAVVDVIIDRGPRVDDFRAGSKKMYSKGHAAT